MLVSACGQHRCKPNVAYILHPDDPGFMGGCQLLAAEKKDEKDDCAWLLGLDLLDLSVLCMFYACSMHLD